MWKGNDGTTDQIYRSENGGAPVLVSTTSTDNANPQILGNTIVWYGNDGSTNQIYKSTFIPVTPPTPPSPTPIVSIDDIRISDPCSCDNPNNILLPRLTNSFLFEDTLTVTTTTGLNVVLSATDGNLLDRLGNPIPINTVIPENPAGSGTYKLQFYTLPNTPADITVNNGSISRSFTTISCTRCEAPIPTMSQWGLLIFGLLVLNMGVFFVQRRELV